MIYISGPMTGYANLNASIFRHLSDMLMVDGRESVIPHNLTAHLASPTHAECMRLCLQRLVQGDVTLLLQLPGWLMSRGCYAEWIVARSLGIKVELCLVLEYWQTIILQKLDGNCAPTPAGIMCEQSIQNIKIIKAFGGRITTLPGLLDAMIEVEAPQWVRNM